jgi:hypothetical protein
MRSGSELAEQAFKMAQRLHDPWLIADALILRYAAAGFLGKDRCRGTGGGLLHRLEPHHRRQRHISGLTLRATVVF